MPQHSATLRRAAVALAAVAAGSCVWAAAIDKLDVAKRRGRYSLVADAHLAATPQSIYAVLIDYDDNRFARISSAYKESRYLDPAPDGTPIVYTRMEGCVLWHCITFNRVERLETRPPNWIKSYTLADRSNFKYSTSEWTLEPDGAGGTHMIYKIEMEPDFWVPPIIGPWAIKRELAQGGPRVVRRIENLARQLEGLPIDPTVPAPGTSSR
jgi:hypothetical protein